MQKSATKNNDSAEPMQRRLAGGPIIVGFSLCWLLSCSAWIIISVSTCCVVVNERRAACCIKEAALYVSSIDVGGRKNASEKVRQKKQSSLPMAKIGFVCVIVCVFFLSVFVLMCKTAQMQRARVNFVLLALR